MAVVEVVVVLEMVVVVVLEVVEAGVVTWQALSAGRSMAKEDDEWNKSMKEPGDFTFRIVNLCWNFPHISNTSALSLLLSRVLKSRSKGLHQYYPSCDAYYLFLSAEGPGLIIFLSK